MSEPTPVKRPRHLMDPANPRPPATRGSGMSLSTVQKWVMSTLAVTTILHMSLGLILAAAVIEDARRSSQIGLLVIAGIFGVFAVLAGMAIHQARLLSPWPLLGVLPALVGAYVIL